MSHLLEWPAATILSSEQQASVSPLLVQSCPVRIYSSDAWHSQDWRVQHILSGSFMLHDRRSERREAFVPRRVPSKTGEYVRAKSGRYPAPDLAVRILEEVDRFPLATPASLVQYIAPEYLPADISSALAGLERQGAIMLEPKDPGSGPKVFSYTLTERGRGLLKELNG